MNVHIYNFSCDVSDRAAVFELAKNVKRTVGVVTILVNNAGIMPTRPLLEQSEGEIRKTFDINVLANLWVNYPTTLTNNFILRHIRLTFLIRYTL